MQILILIVLAVALGACYSSLRRTRLALQNEKSCFKYLERHVKRRQGVTKLWPGFGGEFLTYDLRSWDAGSTWFAVEMDKDHRMTIKGAAEAVYPGLLSNLLAGDRLFQAAEFGPLDPNDQKSIQLLSQAGFGVSSGENAPASMLQTRSV